MTRFKLLLIFLLVVSSIAFIPVMADSGWDNDYGSSSSSDWGSSSDHSWSSSSYDHDWGSDHDRDHDYSGFGLVSDIFYFILFLVLFIDLIVKAKEEIFFRKHEKKGRKKALELIDAEVNYKIGNYANCFDSYKKHAIGDLDCEIQKFFPNLNEGLLIEELFRKFVDVQRAWMNFDYDSLKRLCSDELYNSYKSDLEVLKLKNGKNVMNDFVLISGNIDRIREENNIIIIDAYLSMSFLDFVINTNNKKIINGDPSAPMFCRYNLKYIVSKNTRELLCSNCGAKLEPGTKQCNYCNSTINNNYGDFVLSVKEKI